MSIKQYLENFDKGMYSNPIREVQCEAGWYDWFCKDSALARKTVKLTKKLKQIVNSPKINVEKHYVWFKNNCPINGGLYDDFRIAEIGTSRGLYTVIPASGHAEEKGQSQVWGNENDFNGPIVAGTWEDVVKFFKE